jgi:hypothetical protein
MYRSHGVHLRFRRLAHLKSKARKPVRRLKPLEAKLKLGSERTLWPAAVFITAGLAALPSMADDTMYNASAQNEFLTNLAGVGYIILVGFFLTRVFTRRAKRFREEVRDLQCVCSSIP